MGTLFAKLLFKIPSNNIQNKYSDTAFCKTTFPSTQISVIMGTLFAKLLFKITIKWHSKQVFWYCILQNNAPQHSFAKLLFKMTLKWHSKQVFCYCILQNNTPQHSNFRYDRNFICETALSKWPLSDIQNKYSDTVFCKTTLISIQVTSWWDLYCETALSKWLSNDIQNKYSDTVFCKTTLLSIQISVVMGTSFAKLLKMTLKWHSKLLYENDFSNMVRFLAPTGRLVWIHLSTSNTTNNIW